MSFKPCKKATVLIPTGGGVHHIFFVATEICNAGRHLLVNATTIDEQFDYDKTCVVPPGVHPFIVHPSYMIYGHARILTHDGIIKCVNSGEYIPHEPASDELIKMICDGILPSRFAPPHIKAYYRLSTGQTVVVKKRNIKKP